jgi:type IV pilus assembly protein PilA
MRTLVRGFTLIELMVVIAVLAILAMLALPSLQGSYARQQVVDSSALINLAKTAVSTRWSSAQSLPADNTEAALPPPDKMVGSYVQSVRVESGAVHVVFGNQANGAIRGKTLSFRPAVVESAPVVPIAWVCGHAATPDKMIVKGENRTDVAPGNLPLNCRG